MTAKLTLHFITLPFSLHSILLPPVTSYLWEFNTNTISYNEGNTRTYGDEASHNMKGRPSISLKSTPFLFVIPHGRTILS